MIAFSTAAATPPLTANPIPSPLACPTNSLSSQSEITISLASSMDANSSKVSTKSISLLIERLLASSFFAAQGPTKTTLASGCSFFISLPVKTIGVSAIEMYGANSGKSFLAITDHAGQQEVAMKGCLSGTSLVKSLASSIVHKSAPIATSTTSVNPSFKKAVLI